MLGEERYELSLAVALDASGVWFSLNLKGFMYGNHSKEPSKHIAKPESPDVRYTGLKLCGLKNHCATSRRWVHRQVVLGLRPVWRFHFRRALGRVSWLLP